jgi:ABC-type bacteriocin/lantibiotic exporter with double-glycine peptidase domain
MKNFPYFKQETCWTCGPAVIRMFLAGNGIKRSEKQLTKILKTNKMVGTRQSSFLTFAQKYKYNYLTGDNSNIKQLTELYKNGFFILVSFMKTITDDPRYPFKLRKDYPIEENHIAAIKKITKGRIFLLDPTFGENENYSIKEFERMWSRLNYYEKDKRWFFAIKKS